MAEELIPERADSSPLTHQLRELGRMESAVVRADTERTGVVTTGDVRRLRYLLGFARLTRFQPGAASTGGLLPGVGEVDFTDQLAAFRARAVEALDRPLREEQDPGERLRRGVAELERLAPALEEERTRILEGGELSRAELDAECGRKLLVNVCGGGGGAGFVYIGAWRRLDEERISPGYVVGASIGALLGIFRARLTPAPWDEYVALARSLDRRKLFSGLALRRRHGLPGLLALHLHESIGGEFVRDDGEPLRISDLETPYEAIVGGVRSRSFDRLPRRFRRATDSPAAAPEARRSAARLAPAVATRMWQAAAFFDPRVVKPVVLGDKETAEFDAIDAAGFAAAIPGVLHYEAGASDARMHGLLDALFERQEVSALVDGGVVANVPAEIAWRRVQAGRLGTRNTFVLAFDCFHPQWDPRHLWLQPITQAIQLQMARNSLFADWIVRFEPTLSPVNLVPEPAALDRALGWGRASIEEALPLVRRMLEPAAWD